MRWARRSCRRLMRPTARVRLAVVLSHPDVGEADLGPVLCALLGRKPEDADAIVRVVTDW